MSTVNGFQVGSETLKYNYESLDNYNTPNFSTSSSKTYVVGDYVIYNGKLYKCITATTGGTWVSGSWTLAVLSDDVSDLKSQLSDVKDNQIPYLRSALGLVVSEFEFGDIYVENGQATYYDANNRIRTKDRNGVALDAGTTIELPSGFVFRVISLTNVTYSYLTEWVNFTTIEASGVYYILARKTPTVVLDSVSEITSVLKIYAEDGYDNTIKTLENDIQKNFQKVNTLSVPNAKVYRVNTASTEESPTGTRLRVILHIYDGFYFEAQSSAGSGLAAALYETLDKALYAGSDYIKVFRYNYSHAVISGSSNVGGYLCISAKKDDGSSFSDEEVQAFVNAINLSVDSKITKVVNEQINGGISFLNADMGTALVAMSGYNTYLSGGSGQSTAYKKNLSFAVITDLHGSGDAFERFITYANENEQYLDFAICLGDLVPYAPWQDIQWYFNAIEKSKVPVYFVPGNHDIADTYSSAINESEARTRYFSPIISKNWLTESNFQGAEKCSWYKDFADYGIRIISLFEYGNSQPIDNDAPPTYSRRWMDSSLLQWFADTLYGTPENFAVIVFLHQTPYDNIDYIQNKFTQTYRDVSLAFMNTIDGNPIEEIVDAFIHSGTISKTYNSIASYDLGKQATVSKDFSGRSQNGMFVGYICGHTHAAIVANAGAYTDQKIILVNTGSNSFYQRQWSDLNYDDNNRNKDCFYCIGIDKTAGNVNLTQIGGQTTLDMRKRDFDKVKFTS